MTYLQAIILGIIQGGAELLPLSAPAHLVILHSFFGLPTLDEEPLLALLLRLGVLLGLCFACKTTLRELLRSFFALFDRRETVRTAGRATRRMLLLWVIAALPLLLVPPFRARLQALEQKPALVGVLLWIGGAALLLAGRVRGGTKDHRRATLADAVWVGLGQAVGMLPGLGRGLGGVCMGLWRRLDRQFAAELSLLLAIPALLGSEILSLAELVRLGGGSASWTQALAGMAAAGATAYGAARLFRLLGRIGRVGDLGYYCFGLGFVTLGLSLIA